MKSIRQFFLLLLPTLVCFLIIIMDGATDDLTDSSAFIVVIFGFFSIIAAIYVWVYQRLMQRNSALRSFLLSAALVFVCTYVFGYLLVRIYNNEESYLIPLMQGIFFIIIFGFYVAAVRLYKSARSRAELDFSDTLVTYIKMWLLVFAATVSIAFLAQVDYLPEDVMSHKKRHEFITFVIPTLQILTAACLLLLYALSKISFFRKNFLVSIVLVSVFLSFINLYNPLLPEKSDITAKFGYMLLIFGFTSVIAAIVLIRNAGRTKAIAAEKLRSSFRKNEASYQQLRSQVNPHFFLNNLNMLLSYIETDPQQALVFGKRLSAIYQKFLKSDTKDFVPLDQEMEFASEYLEVYKAKFGEGIRLQVEKITMEGQYILSHVIQEAIDNIIKHNSGDPESPLCVTIGIQDEMLVVSNNILPRIDKISNGTGLGNIVERYKILTGKAPIIRQTDSHFRIAFPIFPLA